MTDYDQIAVNYTRNRSANDLDLWRDIAGLLRAADKAGAERMREHCRQAFADTIAELVSMVPDSVARDLLDRIRALPMEPPA